VSCDGGASGVVNDVVELLPFEGSIVFLIPNFIEVDILSPFVFQGKKIKKSTLLHFVSIWINFICHKKG
jgi:hypothetical protein